MSYGREKTNQPSALNPFTNSVAFNLFLFAYPQMWRDADHSPPNNAKVKKTWIYTSTPPYVFRA
jgi:hypothetical protein